MLTVIDYLTQHEQQDNVPPEVATNAADLIPRVNSLLNEPDCPVAEFELRSGYRPPAFNSAVPNASRTSKHMTGDAVDVSDNDGAIDAWLTDAILERHGLYREAPDATPSWCHLQQMPPRSGHRTFNP